MAKETANNKSSGNLGFENDLWRAADALRSNMSVFHECQPGRRKIAVKVVDIFGNDTMTIVDVAVGGKKG